MLEKIHSFGDESKYDVASAPGGQIQADYEEKRTDAWSQIEELGVVKRIVSLGESFPCLCRPCLDLFG